MLNLLALATLALLGEPTAPPEKPSPLDVEIPRVESPSIRIDAHLNEPEWELAAVLTGFTQYEPVEGIPATELTEVRVFYSEEAIYFGVRAFDREPDLIMARLGERDRAAFGDDWVRILLDTFDDQRQAYVFYVNPLGLQTDGLWIEGLQRGRSGGAGMGRSGVSIDYNPDFIWESDGEVTDEGWVAEIKIPYVSLRFPPDPVQSWGINISREVKRRGFKQSWAPVTKDISSTLAQSGHLVGLQGLRPRRLMEVNPVATGKRTGTARDNGAFLHDDLEPEFGLNARYGITQNLVIDATANPDFSQIEADAERITVNERFALYYAEKRPFFLDGAEVFQTPQRLVHTRSIIDPIGGAKLTGKIGDVNVGYLGALDESPTTFGEGEEKAIFNLFRVRRDIGTGSTLGLLYTDRTLTGGKDFNRVVAADARILLNGRYTWTTQVAGSWTREGGESGRIRPLVTTTFQRSGREFGWLVKFEDIHPDFNAGSGFIPRVGNAQLFASGRAVHFGAPGALMEQMSVEVRLDGFFDHDTFWESTHAYEAELQIQPTIQLRGDRQLGFIVRDGYYEFLPEEYAAYSVQGEDGSSQAFQIPKPLKTMKAFALYPNIRINNSLSLRGIMYLREVPIYAEASRGFEFQISPTLTMRPTTSVALSLTQTFSRLYRVEEQQRTLFSRAIVSRANAQYLFSRALMARLQIQYNLMDRDALKDPTTGLPLLVDDEPVAAKEDGSFQGQLLLQYEPSPGTIFYVGYSRLMEGDFGYNLRRMDPTVDGLFVKLSYLFRI